MEILRKRLVDYGELGPEALRRRHDGGAAEQLGGVDEEGAGPSAVRGLGPLLRLRCSAERERIVREIRRRAFPRRRTSSGSTRRSPGAKRRRGRWVAGCRMMAGKRGMGWRLSRADRSSC